MVNDNTKILTDYVSIWGWQITSMIFLVGGIIILNTDAGLIRITTSCALIILSLGIQLKNAWRIKKFYGENK